MIQLDDVRDSMIEIVRTRTGDRVTPDDDLCSLAALEEQVARLRAKSSVATPPTPYAGEERRRLHGGAPGGRERRRGRGGAYGGS